MDELQKPQTFRDTVSTVDVEGHRRWMYAHQPHGKLYNYRTALTIVFLLVFFSMPLIKINGTPFFQLDFLNTKFILFGKIFWPTDFFIFAIGMISFILFVSLFTVVYGRLFCGWVCPQTIFMDMIFRRIEFWIEGSANEQKVLDRSPWNFNKIWRKALKHSIYLILAFLIANTFLAYIIGADKLMNDIREPLTEHISLLMGLVVFTLIFYSVFAFVREIVCTTICPYGRLQGVLLDPDSIVVAYDHKRGETRGKFNKSKERTIGDCIDCNQCVNVCPTGIDIRNGTQLECTNCTACIDACNFMMEKVGLPTGLIRYTSENGITNNTKLHMTTKITAYTVVLFVLVAVMAFLLITRKDVDATIVRASGQLYQERPDEKLSNLYNFKVLNKTDRNVTLFLRPDGFTGEIRLIGVDEIRLKKAGQASATFFILLPKKNIKERKTKLKIDIFDKANGKKIETVSTTFLGPFI